MSIIYEPRGKAREYSELAVNLYTGCSHGCRYPHKIKSVTCVPYGMTFDIPQTLLHLASATITL